MHRHRAVGGPTLLNSYFRQAVTGYWEEDNRGT